MKIARIMGINIMAGPMALGLLFMATISVYGAVVPTAFGALIVGLGFLASILLHEYGHALVARRFGVDCPEIHLHIFGGAAMLTTPIPSPKAEFWIAIAGPLVSFALAGIFTGCAALAFDWQQINLDHQLDVSMFARITGYLALVNLVLGVFNLLPAFPMDGGRILRAAIWAAVDYQYATRVAVYTGYGFAALMAASGLYILAGGQIPYWGMHPSDGLMKILLGGFIFMIAKAEARMCLRVQVPVPNPEERYQHQEIE